jgi:hypothetical protein
VGRKKGKLLKKMPKIMSKKRKKYLNKNQISAKAVELKCNI